MKKIAILGSTGSIGQSTLDVVAQNREAFDVVALTAGKNLELFVRQIELFRPELVAVPDRETAVMLRERVNGPEILEGEAGIRSVAADSSADFVVSSIVGSAGLIPTVAAIQAGKHIGLANKESLVMAGKIVMDEARKKKVNIIPVDSEHSAVFQCIEGRQKKAIKRIILTASGGPFVSRRKEELPGITPEDALQHPNWSMGKKITIDSATLMNKGLEVIEASWLFDVTPDDIDVLIHPQSIVHSLVEFTDRSFLAQMSIPDMRGPISFALSYPERLADPIPALELDKVGCLTFQKPDHDTFPCLSYAYEAIRAGGTMPCVLNAANEVAVHAFLQKQIGFTDIPSITRKVLDSHTAKSVSELGDVLDADRTAREAAKKYVRESAK